jgi:solute carrier family 25 phosphate transporter 23/24/25/41
MSSNTGACENIVVTSETWNTVKSLSAGATAGIVSRSMTSPLERLKVMKQVQSRNDKFNGIGRAFARMYREDGVRGFWRGNGANVIRVAPMSAIQFASFAKYKKLISENAQQATVLETLCAGAIAGMTASIVCYPLDFLRSLLSVQTSTNQHYKGMIPSMLLIIRTKGPSALYRGLLPTLAGVAPYIAINMTTFDVLKHYYLPLTRDAPYFTLINLALGATAGSVAAAATYPSDVIRRRMQLQGLEGCHDLPPYQNTFHCVSHTIRTEGVRGLYKGLFPCFMKVIPSMAIAFTTFEFLKHHMGFDPSILEKAPSSV